MDAEHLLLDHLKDLKILNQLCEVYYQNTGMLISFCDPGAGSLAYQGAEISSLHTGQAQKA